MGLRVSERSTKSAARIHVTDERESRPNRINRRGVVVVFVVGAVTENGLVTHKMWQRKRLIYDTITCAHVSPCK